jgi:hypothetical protein
MMEITEWFESCINRARRILWNSQRDLAPARPAPNPNRRPQ